MARSNEYVTLSKTALGVALIRAAFYKTITKLEVYVSLEGVYLLRVSNVYTATCDTDSATLVTALDTNSRLISNTRLSCGSN